jgi:hypothetical protein
VASGDLEEILKFHFASDSPKNLTPSLLRPVAQHNLQLSLTPFGEFWQIISPHFSTASVASDTREHKVEQNATFFPHTTDG